MIHIYSKEGKFKDSLNYTKEEFVPEWYENYKKGDIISEVKYEHPIVDENGIREMTRNELLRKGFEVSLNPGEIIKNNEIIIIPQPTKYHFWENNSWKVDLKELKSEKRNELKKARDAAVEDNITIGSDTFQVRAKDMETFWEIELGLRTGDVQADKKRAWILANNTVKEFSYEELLNVLITRAKRKAIIFDKFNALEDKLEKAKTIDEIEKIEWN